MEIAVVIPAYNEERRIGGSLERILSYLDGTGRAHEIVVVDDGSRDGTSAVARRYTHRGVRTIRLDPNHGKGFAVRQGVMDARAPLVLFSDADLSTPIEELEKLEAPIRAGTAEIAIGSRAVAGAVIEVAQPPYREWMGKVFNRLVQVIAVPGIRDTQCGFKLFTRRAALEVFRRQRLDGFGFDVEVMVIARQLGFRIAEVPVRWINSPETKVDAVRDSARMFADLFRVRWNALRGRYR